MSEPWGVASTFLSTEMGRQDVLLTRTAYICHSIDIIPVDLPWLESGGLEPRLKIKFSPNLVAFYQLLGLGVCGAGDVCKRWAPPIYWVLTMVME